MSTQPPEVSALEASVSAGHARWDEKEVSADIEGKGKVKKTFRFYTALDLDGARAFCNGLETTPTEKDKDGNDVPKRGVRSVVGLFNYASDLDQRGPFRAALLAENEGPSKQIERGVKALMAAAGLSEDEARVMVVETRKAKGLPVE